MTSEVRGGKLLPEFSLPTEVFQGSKSLKNVLTETINKTVDTVADTAEKAKFTLIETSGQAVHQVTRVSNQAISSITQTSEQTKEVLNATAFKAVGAVKESTEKAKITLSEASGQAVHQITQATEQSLSSLTETTEQAKASIAEMVQGTENLTGGIADAIQVQLSSIIHNWLVTHPAVFWIISHPLPALGIVLLGIFLLRGLLKLLAQSIEKLWLLVLKSPFLLGQFLFRGSKLVSLKGANGSQPVLPESEQFLSLESPEQQVQLAQILQKLEKISQEQSQLLQKVMMILESNKQVN